VVDDIAGIRKPEMVSGRIYSGWGEDDYASLRDGQMVLLCLAVPEHWNPGGSFKGLIQQWAAENDVALRDLETYLGQLILRLEHQEFQGYQSIFNCLKEGAGDNAFTDASTSVKQGLEDLLDTIKSVREQSLVNLAISQSRLREVALWVSSKAFSKDLAAFPVSVFNRIQSVTTQGQEYTLNINSMNKGEFTEPEMVQRAVNESDWFSKSFREYTAGQVMADILKALSPVKTDASSPDQYWEQIKRGAIDIRAKKLTPILLVDNPTQPEWLWKWSLSEYDENTERPKDLRMLRDKALDGSSGYQGSLNDIAVYIAPIPHGASFLIARESLGAIRFTDFGDDIFVKVEHSLVADKPSLINLHLKWAYEMDIEKYPALELRYIKSKESDA